MKIVQFIPPSQRKTVFLAAQTDTAPVLIIGQSGTGKSGLARWIHENSPRSTGPLITLGKDEKINDLFSEAHGGTLIITEIGERPLAEQSFLLQFLKSKSITYKNEDGDEIRKILNVRVIVTTSQCLEKRAQAGLFNQELFHKINVFRIEMPELSSRLDEFEDIVLGIISEIKRELHKDYIKGLTELAWDSLKEYSWPGNLRELRNVLRVAVITTQGDMIDDCDLPDFDIENTINFKATREEFEKIYLSELLKTFHWELDKTSEASRIPVEHLKAKMKKYGIHPKPTLLN